MPKTLLLLELECPHCKRVLTKGEKVPLDAFLKDTHQDGQVALSALFGDYTIETDLKIPEGGSSSSAAPNARPAS